MIKNNELYRNMALTAGFLFASIASPAPAAANSHPPPRSVPQTPWPALTPVESDPRIEAFISQLLSQMSLEEKVGQMIQADIASITPAQLAQYKLGSILAGGNAAPNNNPRTSPQSWLDLTDEFYRAALSANSVGHAPIPIIFGIDAVHGNAKLVGATVFPHNVGLGAAHDANLVRDIGAATAEEVSSVGIDWTFAPTVAVVRDVRWGRSYESYSESPDLVARYAAAIVEGVQGPLGDGTFLASGHTLTSVKHFIGDGGTRDGRDQGDTQVSESQLRDVHAAGYLPALKAGAMIVMASYNSWNGVKIHGNHYLLTDVLKGKMGFRGFVVGDWNAHEQIPGCTKTDCPAAILAGVDMLMAPDGWQALFANTVAEARKQLIPSGRIDDAVRRILRVKATAGMFERKPPKERFEGGQLTRLGSPDHRALARRAVRESLVLLKNQGGVLPINPSAHILVCGDLADDIGAQAGGWTIDWQGDHNRNEDFPGATSLFAGLHAAAAAAGGSAVLSANGEYRERPDVAVVIFGERPYAEFQGDRETLEFSPRDKKALQLLQALRRDKIPTVSVFLSGRPLWINPEINASDAVVAAWLPGSEGEGVADVLFGSADGKPVDFTGRLSFSWPDTAMPVSFHADGSISGALHPSGFGLTYRDRTKAAELSEAAHVAPAYFAPAGSLYHAAHPTAPWSVFLADGGEQVHVTTAHSNSPHAAISAESSEMGIHLTWSGKEPALFEISGRAESLAADPPRTELRFKYRVDAPPSKAVQLKILCTQPSCGTAGGVQHDVTRSLRDAPVGRWRTMRLPLSCFSLEGADLSEVEMPFVISTEGRLSLSLSEITLETAAAAAPSPCAGAG
jgi:beta-glucosidase